MKFHEFVIKCEAEVFNQVLTVSYNGKANYMQKLFKISNSLLAGTSKNWLVNLPPRVGKSRYFCVYFMAYALGCNPASQFLYISYAEDLTKTQMLLLKEIMKSDFFASVFPDCKLKGNTSWKTLSTTKGGIVRSNPIHGTFTGFGAGKYHPRDKSFTGAVIFDDPHDAKDAYSVKKLTETCTVFANAIMTRLNHTEVPFIITGQRVSDRDIFSFLKINYASLNWNELVVPACNEETGETIAPDRLSFDFLMDRKKENYPLYMAQYQQNPVENLANIFKMSDFKYIEDVDPTFRPHQLIMAVDPNGCSAVSPDMTAIITAEIFYLEDKPNLLIHRIFQKKFNKVNHITDAVINTVLESDEWASVLIETHTNGNAIFEAVREFFMLRECSIKKSCFVPTKRCINKREFMHACASYVSSGRVYLHRGDTSTYNQLQAEADEVGLDNPDCKDDVLDALSEIIFRVFIKKSVKLAKLSNDVCKYSEKSYCFL